MFTKQTHTLIDQKVIKHSGHLRTHEKFRNVLRVVQTVANITMCGIYPCACGGISFSLVVAQMQAEAQAQEKGKIVILVLVLAPVLCLNQGWLIFNSFLKYKKKKNIKTDKGSPCLIMNEVKRDLEKDTGITQIK